jgi:hypothetical protein
LQHICSKRNVLMGSWYCLNTSWFNSATSKKFMGHYVKNCRFRSQK